MTIKQHRHDHGRVARATDLVALLSQQIPLGHPARPTVRELQRLFVTASTDRIRELLEQVPGSSLAEKGRTLNCSKQAISAIWYGRFKPSAELMDRIEAAAKETVDAE